MYNVTKAIKHIEFSLYSINKDKYIIEFSVVYTVGPDDKVLPPVILIGSSVVELDSENPNLIKNYRACINGDPFFIIIDVSAGADA